MRRSNAVPLGSSYLALATLATTAGLVAACAGREQVAYCGDANGVVVDDSVCDSGRGGYYLWTGSYRRGLRPGDRLSGGTRVAPGDAEGRVNSGLPASGKVSNGSVVRGGFGSGHGSSGG